MKNVKNARIGLFDKITCFILVIAILFTSMPFRSKGEETPEYYDGIGIYNHVLTSQQGVNSRFKLEFYHLVSDPVNPGPDDVVTYSYQKVDLPGEYQFTDDSDQIVYLSVDGTTQIAQGKKVTFLDSSTPDSDPFKRFLKANQISRIVITPELTEIRDAAVVPVMEEYHSGDSTYDQNGYYSGANSTIDNTEKPAGDPAKDEAVKAKSKIYKLNYDGSGQLIYNYNDDTTSVTEEYKLKQFDLTPMVELDVNVQWRDTNSGRPDSKTVGFDISRQPKGETAESYIVDTPISALPGGVLPDDVNDERYGGTYANNDEIVLRTITKQDSNNDVYTYLVPEQSVDGKAYDYTAAEKLTDSANYSITAVNKTSFTNYSLKDFTCKVNWLDGAHDNEYTNKEGDITKTPEKILDFIKNNFELIDETDPEHPINILSVTAAKFDALTDTSLKEYIQNTYDKVTDANNNVTGYNIPADFFSYEAKTDDNGKTYYELSVKKLLEITADGTARIYSMKQKTVQGNSEPQPLPVTALDSSASYADHESDTYKITATNEGVKSDIVDRAYEGGELNMLLTGTTTFEGELVWADIDKQAARVAAVENQAAGDFMLYRYVVDPSNPNSYEMVSQVGTWKIASGSRYEYTENGVKKYVDKYDNSGKEYVYFAKERLSMSGYSISYILDGLNVDHYPFGGANADGTYNGTKVFPNVATVKNTLTGSIAYGVDAKWIAAELQGGTAEIVYQIQKYDPETKKWEDVQLLSRQVKDENDIVLYTEYYNGEEWVQLNAGDPVPDNSITLDAFSAEQMELNDIFAAVSQYDSKGHAYQYRLVQTTISRTDNGATNEYTTPIEMAYDNDGKVIIDGNNNVKLIGTDGNQTDMVRISIGKHDFEVRVKWDSSTSTYKYEYKLVGDIKAVINKDWSGVPMSQLSAVRDTTVTIQLMKYNYTTGKFERFTPTEVIKYTNGTKENGQLVEYEATDGQGNPTGQFRIVRKDVVEGVSGIQPNYAIELLNVPMYDDEGHLNRFTLSEVSASGVTGCSPVFSADLTKDPRVYTANNIFGDGGEEIHFHKVWMDDGEEEYKCAVGVDMSARAMRLPIQSNNGELAPIGWETMTDEQIAAAQSSTNSGTKWLFEDPWNVRDTNPFTDPFMDALKTQNPDVGIGYRYQNSNGTSPNSFSSGSGVGYVPLVIPLIGSDYPGLDSTNLSNISNRLNYAKDNNVLLNPGQTMDETNVWTARIQVRIGYSYHQRTDEEPWGYDLKDFQERMTGGLTDQHTFQFRQDDIVEAKTDIWKNMLPAQYSEGYYVRFENLPARNGNSIYSYRVVNTSNKPLENAELSVTYKESESGIENDTQTVIVTSPCNGTDNLVFKLQRSVNGTYFNDFYSGDAKLYNGNTVQDSSYVYTLSASDINHKITANVVNMNTKGAVYTYTNGSNQTVDPISFDWFAGVYKAVYDKNGNYDRYYAVQEEPTINTSTGKLSDVTFTNTRIGIVNYRVHFDWNVGSRLDEMKNVTVRIMADYHDGNGPQPVKIPVEGGQQGETTDEIRIDLINGVNDYYITDLPKYSNTGKIITYTLNEVKVNGMSFDKNGKCKLQNDDLYVDIKEDPYIVNDRSNSDDLIPIVITNTFKGKTDCTVNKVWKDDTNALNTRTDLYIKLFRHSTQPGQSSADTQVSKDYNWKKYSTDTDNHWSYTFESLPKYDSEGFRYEYYVKEITTNLITNDYKTYYENAVHMGAQGSNSKRYTSNDSMFTIPHSDLSPSFYVTIAGLDAKDDFYEGEHPEYTYRVTDITGTPFNNNEVTITQITQADGTVTVTVRPVAAFTDDFIFRLQRKVTELSDEDLYADVPDYYDIPGQTEHANYDGEDGRTVNGTTIYGRAYDNGTIINKLVGTVEIKGTKLWQNIADALQKKNYPIADVFLYANIKSHQSNYSEAATEYVTKSGNNQQTYNFEQGGYAIIEGAADPALALGELVNMSQIKNGDDHFGFSKQKTVTRDNNNAVQYVSGDYVRFDETDENAMPLDKYDENGALIKYTLKERAINGYTYRISNDKIINEYNGGDRVQVKVSKEWKNMEAGIIYPTVRFTLYQCYVGKDSSNQQKLLVYQTFVKEFHSAEWVHANNKTEYYFGGEGNKENLYRYSPTGEEFFYYVTEELIGAGKPGDPVSETGHILFSKTYSVDSNGVLNTKPTLETEDMNKSGDNKVIVDGEHTGLGFAADIEESVDLCFAADRITGAICVPETNTYVVQNIPPRQVYKDMNNETVTHDFTYRVVECDADGELVQNSGNTVNMVANSYHSMSDGTYKLEVAVTKGENNPNVYFKLQRKTNVEGDTWHDVYTKSDGSTLWAAKTGEDNTRPLHKQVDITNTYEPDENNYKSKLTVNKTWESYNDQNPLNKEFNGVSNYKFMLKRSTANIGKKSLFMVDTGTENNIPSISIAQEYKDPIFIITVSDFKKMNKVVVTAEPAESSRTFKLQRSADGTSYTDVSDTIYTLPANVTTLTIPDMELQDDSAHNYTYKAVTVAETPADFGTCTISSDEAYFGSVITLNKTEDPDAVIKVYPQDIKVTVRVYETTKKVEIEGLAIYGQNGIRYSYVVDEIQMNAFHRKNEDPIEKKIELEKNVDGRVIGGHAEFTLDNQLKYIYLNINKTFGAEYKDAQGNTQYEALKPEDYPLYFNDGFLKTLEFTLQRKKQTELNWSEYTKLTINDTKPAKWTDGDYKEPAVTENADGTSTIDAQFSVYTSGNKKGQLYYTFKYLPVETIDGELYQYRVIEKNAVLGDHVTIYYPTNNPTGSSYMPQSESPATTESPLSFVVMRAEEGSTTPLTDISASANGATIPADTTTGVITVPVGNMVNDEYKVTVSDLPLSANGTKYSYYISGVTGGRNVSVNQTVSGNNVTLTVRADSDRKYYSNTAQNTQNQPSFEGPSDTNNYSAEYKNPQVVYRDLYICNIFEGKEIYVEKRWNDDNNADGLRPEALDVTLHEEFDVGQGQTPPAPVKLQKTLQSSQNWGRTILMPKYYYNGQAPTNNVLVSVKEDLSTAKLYYYSETDNTTLQNVKYEKESSGYILKASDGKLSDTVSDFSGNASNDLLSTDHSDNTDNTLYGMYIQNKKDHVNSKLEFEKKWDDNNNQLQKRPESIYIKTIRKTKGTLQLDGSMQFKVDPSEVDTAQPALISGLAAADPDGHAYRYYFDPELPFTVASNGTTVDISANLSGVSDETNFTLKRSTDIYKAQTFTAQDGKFTIDGAYAINDLFSVRISDLPVSDGDVNYSYRVVDADGKPRNDVTVNYYPSGDDKKDIVITKAKTGANFVFGLQRFSTYSYVSDMSISPGSVSDDTCTVSYSSAVNNKITVTVSGLNAADEYTVENLTETSWANVTVTDGVVSGARKSIIITAERSAVEGEPDFRFKIQKANYADVTDKDAELYFESDIPKTYQGESKTYSGNTAAYYTIPASDKLNGVYSFKLEGLESGTYKLVGYNANKNLFEDIPATFSYSQKNDKTDAAVTVKSDAESLEFKIRKKGTGSTFEDYTGTVTVGQCSESIVAKDNNGSDIRVEYFPKQADPKTVINDSYGNAIGYYDNNKKLSASPSSITIPADYAFKGNFAILVKDLPAPPEGNNYTVTGAAREAVRKSGENTVDLLVTKAGTEGFTFSITAPTGVTLPASVTAARFFLADGNGIVEIPADADITKSVAEHLDYGISVGKTNAAADTPSKTVDGIWEKYYYTVVECDKNGIDDQSTLSFAQTEDGNEIATGQKISFTINVTQYHEGKSDPRKYLNIKLVDTAHNDQVIKKDINGSALKLTMTTYDENDTGHEHPIIREYYASNEEDAIPKAGVFVIPAPEYCDTVYCKIEDLPLKINVGSSYETPNYAVKRCKVNRDTHRNQLVIDGAITTDSVPVEKENVCFTYSKTWNSDAANYKLVPENVCFELWRYYVDANGDVQNERVTIQDG